MKSARCDDEYEIAEWSDYGFWIIGTVKTEQEAKDVVKRLTDGSGFGGVGYRKVEKSDV